MSAKLTRRQQDVIDLLIGFQNEHGFMPTCLELAELMGASSANTAVVHLRALKRKGVITISPGVARGIRIVGTLSPEQQRDEILQALHAFFNMQPRSAEYAAEILKRYGMAK